MKAQLKRMFALLLVTLMITNSQSTACASLASYALGAKGVYASEVSEEVSTDAVGRAEEGDDSALKEDENTSLDGENQSSEDQEDQDVPDQDEQQSEEQDDQYEDSSEKEEVEEDAASGDEEEDQIDEDGESSGEDLEEDQEENLEEDASDADASEESQEAEEAQPEEAPVEETAPAEEAAPAATTTAEVPPVPVKRVYEYSDKNISVKATLERADAVPDDAELVVTPVTPSSTDYNYAVYMDALNQELAPMPVEGPSQGEASEGLMNATVYTEENTLLYDIAFMGNEKAEDGTVIPGKKVELQPESGSVKIDIRFKKNQLSEDLGATSTENVQVVHLPLTNEVKETVDSTKDATDISVSDIAVQTVDAKVKINEPEAKKSVVESTTFETDAFSVWAFTGDPSNQIIIPETETETFKESEQYLIKGTFEDLANFGLVGFTSITQNQHIHSNFATDKLIVNWSPGTVGRRNTNQLEEVFYIGSTLENNVNRGQIEIYPTGSQVILGRNLAASGTVRANANDTTYHIVINGTDYEVFSRMPAAENKNGVYYSTILREEKEGSKYVDLEALRTKAENLSSRFADRSASEVTVTQNYQGNGENVLLYERGDQDIACMNFKLSEITDKVLHIDETKVDNKPHLLIINIDAAGADTATLPIVQMIHTSQTYTGEVQTWTNGNVIINVIDSSESDNFFRGTVKTKAGQVSASILAPKATVNAKGNVNGEIIADKIIIDEEFHRDSITFTNEIPSVGGLRVAKTLDGSSTLSEQFSFKLEGLDGAPMPSGSNGNTLIKKNESDGLVTFGFLNFSEEEFNNGKTDYRYKVSEEIPNGAQSLGDDQYLSNGIVYDARKYVIEVHTIRSSNGGIAIGGYTIYDESGTNELANIGYTEGKAGVVTFENLTATNNSAKAVLKAKKAFDGDVWPEEGFKFKLKKVGYNTGGGMQTTGLEYGMPPAQWMIDSTQESQKYYMERSATNSNPTVSFQELGFDQAGTYYYTISEVAPSGATAAGEGKVVKDGIIYDISEHEVVVTVRQVGNGKMATVRYDGKTSLTITNAVERQYGKLQITKTISGPVTKEEREGALKFEITNSKGKWVKADGSISNSAVQIPLSQFTYDSNTDTYSLVFDEIEVEDYHVKEVTKDITGKDVITQYTVTEDQTAGAQTTGDDAAVKVIKDKTSKVDFENNYTNKKGNFVLTKTISGPVTKDEAEGAIRFEVTTSALNNNGETVKKWLTSEGTLSDTQSELKLTDNNVTYDEAANKYTFKFNDIDIGDYTVKETTTDINVKEVTVTYSVTNEGGQPGTAAEGNEITVVVDAQKTTTVDFADDYIATGGPLTITKTFKGDADKLSQTQKGEVTFRVTGPDGYDTTFTYADMTEGSKTLEELMPGEYRVEESNQFFDGYTCATTYQVGSESSQKVDLTADGASISVTNTYTKNTVKQALSVTKEVTGNDFTGDEDFSFTLAKAAGSTASTDLLPEEKTVSAKNGQTATFGEITFEEPGTYYYTITEAAGTTEGMSYSSSPRYAKVVVNWNEDKTAPVVTSIAYGDSKEAADAASASDTLTVANTYAKTTAEINVSKEVKGDSNYAPAEDFTLTVTPSADNPSSEQIPEDRDITIQKGQTATFGPIT